MMIKAGLKNLFMSYKKYLTILLFLFLLLSCTASDEEQLSGRILLWHRFDEADTVVLHGMLTKFSEIYPAVQVVSAAIPPDELLTRYENTAAQGLGPDLLIGANDWIHQLAQGELIKDISGDMSDTSAYLSGAVESLRLSDPSLEQEPEEPVPLYGLPLSLRPVALYYNAKLVSTPATTLDELLAHAAKGQQVTLNSNFDEAFWGIQAFGGQLFDQDGRVILDQGGFANWLRWLKKAQNEPGVIVNKDDLTLRELFIEERAAYYVAGPEVLPLLQEQMGATIGVVPLPAGPHGASGPLLRVETIMFNPASSRNQSKLALELAKFLTNIEQNTVLMRETRRVPANQQLRVDPRAFPLIAGFAAQARSAVPMSNWAQMAVVRELGSNSYTEVLQGVTDLTEAAVKLTNQVNETTGFELVELPDETCQLLGQLSLWHYFSGATQRALLETARRFERDCPSVQVKLRPFATADELYDHFINTPSAERPNLLLGRNDWLYNLAKTEQIVPITAELSPTVQQAYMPASLDALRIGSELFGVPFSLDFMTLYYNTELDNNPPTTLDELLSKAATGQRVIIPTHFDDAFWGISTFEDQLFDGSYRPVWERGFIDWLTWLQQAQETPGIELSDQTVFSSTNQAHLYVAPASALDQLQTTFGKEKIRVTRLPSGPVGEGRPLLHVEGFMFPDAATELTRRFALYATSTKSQERLMERAHRVPVNVNVHKASDSLIELLFAQAQNAILLPNVPETNPLRQSRNWVYIDVLSGQRNPTNAVCQFTQDIKQANSDPTDLSPVCSEQTE